MHAGTIRNYLRGAKSTPGQLATAHHFTEHDNLSPCSWQSAIDPYPEQEESNPHPQPHVHSQEDPIKMYLTDTRPVGVL